MGHRMLSSEEFEIGARDTVVGPISLCIYVKARLKN
jgi:hypothetical protein